MLKIGEFSKVAQVSVKTLRYYDELGLLRPDWVDRYTGYRYYALQQLPRLNRILTLKELGFPLVQIERLLQEDLTVEELQRLMKVRQAELEHQIQAEQSRLNRVAARLRLIQQEGCQPDYDILVKRVPSCIVAGIRDTITDDEDLRSLAEELRSYLNGRNITPGPLSPFMALYYDAEYMDQGTEVEVAVPIQRRLRDGGRIVVHELPGMDTAACVVHQGSHGQLSDAYRALTAWAHANSYRTRSPSREIYLQGFESGLAPDHFVTELQFPVQLTSSPLISEQEIKIMEPKIVNKPAFTVVGLPFTGRVSSAPYENSDQNNEIGKVWDEFNIRHGEIPHVCGPAYGVCFANPNDQEPWYIAGAEVERVEEVPAGMMSISVPAQRYAVFPCTLQTLGETYRYICEAWQPQSGYEHADAPDFEYYDQEFDPANPQQMKLSVYWPIK
jgi:predicted transcriptional regulator YdeE/DNA-binding transcriptional MerR regulator